MNNENKEVNVQFNLCCFCGENISPTDINPCHVTVETTGGAWQVWFCHGGCFKQRLVVHPQIDLSPAHF